MAKKKNKERAAKDAEAPNDSAPAAADVDRAAERPPLPEREAKWKRVLTPGHALALVATLVALYFVWGIVFAPTGTGSNVVLGLLLAMALLYLGTAHIGPILDETLFPGGPKLRAQGVRLGHLYLDEIERLAKRAEKGKSPAMTGGQRTALHLSAQQIDRAIQNLDATKTEKEAEAAIALLEKETKTAEAVIGQIYGANNRSITAQFKSLGIAFLVALALRAFLMQPFQIPSGSMIPTLLVGDHLFIVRGAYGIPIPLTQRFLGEPKYLVRWGVPENGDVVVFISPPWVPVNAGEDWIKRVIAGPGQKVRIEDSVVYVDGKAYEHVGKGKTEKYLDYREMSGRWVPAYAKRQVERVVQRDGSTMDHDKYIQSRTDWPPVGRQYNGLDCDGRECTVKEGFIFVMGDNRDHSADGRDWGAVPIDNVEGKALFIWMSVDGSRRSVDLGRFTLPGFRWDRLFQKIQ